VTNSKNFRRNLLAPDIGSASFVDITPPDAGGLGGGLMDDIEAFTGQFIAYPSKDAHVAHVLWIAHAHLMDAWDSTPRLAVLSPEPGSGKSRVLEVTELLVPRAVQAVNVTPAYLFRKVGDEAGRPTILFDEIDTVFGPKAKDNEEIRGMLNAGHRRDGVAGRCVVKGKVIETEEIPAYCAVALAGLGALPDTILTRSVVLRMRRRAPSETVLPFRRRQYADQGDAFREALESWASAVEGEISGAWPVMPAGIVDRDADVWEPLLAVADVVGGVWPDRARVAAVALVSDAKRETPSLGVKLLSDIRAVFGDSDRLPTATILNGLQGTEESPWADLKGKPLDARRLSRMLNDYGIKSTTIRVGDQTPKGYLRTDLHDAWQRYLGEPANESTTRATSTTEPTEAPGAADPWRDPLGGWDDAEGFDA
jgi:hypothetical protein